MENEKRAYEDILELAESGYSLIEIANEYDLSLNDVCLIIKEYSENS